MYNYRACTCTCNYNVHVYMHTFGSVEVSINSVGSLSSQSWWSELCRQADITDREKQHFIPESGLVPGWLLAVLQVWDGKPTARTCDGHKNYIVTDIIYMYMQCTVYMYMYMYMFVLSTTKGTLNVSYRNEKLTVLHFALRLRRCSFL